MTALWNDITDPSNICRKDVEAIYFSEENRANYGRYWNDDSPETESPQSVVIERSPVKRSQKTVRK